MLQSGSEVLPYNNRPLILALGLGSICAPIYLPSAPIIPRTEFFIECLNLIWLRFLVTILVNASLNLAKLTLFCPS
ncbi:hypothetical protein GGR51DRAFT_257328 [Nemania sp. FL0031]|nr:hypothetical protein GGR51DRAFT_257328 [Nemania sp. FL0031]